LLKDDCGNLPKADMFALGMSLYELARGTPLPSSGNSNRSVEFHVTHSVIGEEWNSIRDGNIALPGYSNEFVDLVKVRQPYM